ncbi:hypothetical protein Q1M64_12980 (plasmid) [Sinorhizobium meliloti]|nr:hypothetical protein Q1M63_14390 [Sinorhizobium meliloti]WKL39819.1 hypothetical protein Q1M64_12980 [Sinorhizobium meliloti]
MPRISSGRGGRRYGRALHPVAIDYDLPGYFIRQASTAICTVRSRSMKLARQ